MYDEKHYNSSVQYIKEKAEKRSKFTKPLCFHTALVKADFVFIKEFLLALSPQGKTFVCNARVKYGDSSSGDTDCHIMNNHLKDYPLLQIQCKELRKSDFQLPLALACTSGSEEVVDVLIEHGCNIFTRDSFGENVIHSLVRFSEKKPEEAVKMFQHIISLLTILERKNLLRVQNERGLFPLDLAANLHLPEIMLSILNTEGVYRFTMRDCVCHHHVLYDVSDYEKKNTSAIHLMKHIRDIGFSRPN